MFTSLKEAVPGKTLILAFPHILVLTKPFGLLGATSKNSFMDLFVNVMIFEETVTETCLY